MKQMEDLTMKVYDLHNHINYSGSADNNTLSHSKPEKELKKASGGEDIVELSAEAMEKFNKVSVMKFDKARIKKDAEVIIDKMKELGIYNEIFHNAELNNITVENITDDPKFKSYYKNSLLQDSKI